MIKYKFDGNSPGIDVVHFDDYGKLFSLCRKLPDASSEIIINSDKIIEIDNIEKTAVISVRKNNMHRNSMNIVSTEMLLIMGFEKLNNEIVAKRLCTRYKNDDAELWVWKNIVLKSKMEIMGTKITTEAIELVTDIKISKSKYKIPKDYKIIKNQKI
jgi:hypothetical protein